VTSWFLAAEGLVVDTSGLLDERTSQPGLTTADIEHFAEHGYIIKRGFLDERAASEAAEVSWQFMPEGMGRDPKTWQGEVSDCRGTLNISDRFGLVKFRHKIHPDPTLKAVSIRNPTLMAAAEQLLGKGRVAPPRRFRGVYPIFPTPEHAGTPVNAHLDVTTEAFKLTYSVYLVDNPPGGGGLTVWPGTHRLLHYACARNSSRQGDINTKSFRRLFNLLNQFDPLEIPGRAGDVIIMHYRLLHAASLNTIADRVRLALYFNVATNDVEFAEGVPSENLWDGWLGVQAVDSPVIEATSRRPAGLLQGWKRSAKRSELLPWRGAWGGFAQSIAERPPVAAAVTALAAAGPG
jgi:hypothetical protein